MPIEMPASVHVRCPACAEARPEGVSALAVADAHHRQEDDLRSAIVIQAEELDRLRSENGRLKNEREQAREHRRLAVER